MTSVTLLMVMGLGSASAVLFPAMSKYDGAFDDGPVFLGFGLGIVGGAFMGLLHGFSDTWALSALETSFFVYAFFFALIEVLMKYVVLNRPSIRGSHNAFFTGMTFGAAEGAFLTVYTLYAISPAHPGGVELVVMFFFSLSLVLVNTATGLFVGFHSYTGERWYLWGAWTLHVAYAVFSLPLVWGIPGWRWAGFAGVLLFSLVAFLSGYGTIYSLLPSEVEKKMRRRGRI